MIIMYDHNLIDTDIKLITKRKYSNNFTFIPIKYKNNNFIIQTPSIYNTGLIQCHGKQYVNLSFINKDNYVIN